jgi:hypothetical protein
MLSLYSLLKYTLLLVSYLPKIYNHPQFQDHKLSHFRLTSSSVCHVTVVY